MKLLKHFASARAATAALCFGLAAAFAGPASDVRAADLDTLEVFAQPGIGYSPMWMADDRGIFAEEGLQVKIRLFPSGTTAFQTYKTGAGDIIFSGDLPALQYWQRGGSYKVIAASNRDSGGYIAATLNEIKTAKDLVGKTIATRVGSTGSYFVSEYLGKNGIDEASVTVKNLDPPLMPVALCKGEIDGFFIWLPAPTKAKEICGDKIHFLTTAEGYMKGYSVIGARAEFLADPKMADKATRFLRALLKGQEIVEKDPDGTSKVLMKRFGFSQEEIDFYRSISEPVLKLDQTFFDDFCSENKWQQRAGLQDKPSDLGEWTWPAGLKSIDTSRVVPPPPPC